MSIDQKSKQQVSQHASANIIVQDKSLKAEVFAAQKEGNLMKKELKQLIEIHENARAYLQRFKDIHEREIKREKKKKADKDKQLEREETHRKMLQSKRFTGEFTISCDGSFQAESAN